MTPTEYLETLSSTDAALVGLVLGEDFVFGIRTDDLDEGEKGAVEWVDDLIKNAPGVTKDLILYKTYTGLNTEGLTKIREGGELVDKAFFSATGKKPSSDKNEVVLKINIPKGTPALELPDGAVILNRGLQLKMEATESGIIPTSLVRS